MVAWEKIDFWYSLGSKVSISYLLVRSVSNSGAYVWCPRENIKREQV